MVSSLSAPEVAELLRRRPEEIVLLDVREAGERTTACIEPSLHIPMQEVPDRTSELPRDRRIVVYCHLGHRSAMVAGFLERSGFTSVAHLDGGIDSWSREIDPSIPRYE